KNIETVEALKIMPLKHYKEKLVVMEDAMLSYENGIQSKEVMKGFHMEIRQGERVFLQGRNGCGKSSIIKAILNRYRQQDGDEKGLFMQLRDFPEIAGGKVELPNQMVISYCAQDTSMLNGTIQEFASANEIDLTLFMALLRKLDFSRIQFEKRIEDYSGGQKKKVLLAASLCKKAHLYIWDEPLNFIDVFSRMQIEELILKFKPTMILVEHDKMFMEHTATRIIHL
ncbi:MAG: ATP-binding cassette domain-containing protein, partial [Lachnospiraceae bacterium]|nr:ATP-binding cassette domain-containing protein [Lachnospiraceae bacterium]